MPLNRSFFKLSMPGIRVYIESIILHCIMSALHHVKEKWTKYYVTAEEMAFIQKLHVDGSYKMEW